MPFEVEPTTTMRPAGAIATAVASWNRRPKPVNAVPAFANPEVERPVGSISLDDEPIRRAGPSLADHHDASVVLDGQVEPVVVGAQIGHDLAALAERRVQPAPGGEACQCDVGVRG